MTRVMPRRSAASGLVAVVLAALAACSSSSQSGNLCDSLASVAGCGSSARDGCNSAIAAQKQQTPNCANMIDALAQCLAGLSLSCTGNGIAANGSGMDPDKEGGGGDNFSSVGGRDIIVNGGCDLEKRGYDACTTCASAVGATDVGVKGIGEPCTGSDCASGLTCTQGECTRACTSDSDCKARSKNCQLSAQFANVCTTIGGAMRCTGSCAFGDTSTCQFTYGSTYHCTSDTAATTQSCVPM